MNSITVNSATGAMLEQVEQPVEIRDENGRLLGHFSPATRNGKTDHAEYYVPDFTEEQLKEWESAPRGRPLKDILADLEKRA